MTAVMPTALRPARRRPDVVLHQPGSSQEPWVAELPEGRYVRIGPDVGRLLGVVDGDADVSALAERLGAPWTAAIVETTLGRLGAAGLLDVDVAAGTPVRPPAAAPRRLQFVAPASVQLTVVNPAAWMDRHRPLVSALSGRAGAAVFLALGAAGLLALAASAPTVVASLSSPLSLGTAAVVFATIMAVTSLHEVGHAAALARHGGRPRRMGIMLFYLSPALFCDVSDGWLLPERQARVRVAIAGVVVQGGCAGLMALGAVLVTGPWHGPLIVVATACYAAGAFNLLPLVKFDGYIALMSALDIPYLRAKAMSDWRRALAHALFGGQRGEPALPGRRWAPWYGLACAVMPLVLVGATSWNLLAALASWGRPGAVLRLAGVLVLVVLLARSFVRVAATAPAGGAQRVRVVMVSLLIPAAALAAAAALPFTPTVRAGYWVAPDGGAHLVVASGDEARAIVPGQAVQLQSQGLVLRSSVGRARVVAAGPPRRVPFSALVPFIRTGVETQARTFALSTPQWSAPHDATGAATVGTQNTSFLDWIGRQVTDPWRTLTW